MSADGGQPYRGWPDFKKWYRRNEFKLDEAAALWFDVASVSDEVAGALEALSTARSDSG